MSGRTLPPARAVGRTIRQMVAIVLLVPPTVLAADNGGKGGVSVSAAGERILEPHRPVSLHFLAENREAAEKRVAVRCTLQANPAYADPVMPDPVLGYDHALGAVSSVSVDGVARGDALLCDGDEHTSFEIPWDKGIRDTVVTVDLTTPRDVGAVRWLAGDANWVFKTDVFPGAEKRDYVRRDRRS